MTQDANYGILKRHSLSETQVNNPLKQLANPRKMAVQSHSPFICSSLNLRSGNDSFPSGHTAIAFAAARFFDKRYATEASLYLYAAAGLTAIARVKADKHYAKDVVAGAALGYASAEYFSSPLSGGKVSFMPARTGFALVWQKPLF